MSDDSTVYKPPLAHDTPLQVVGGPVEASGYRWYKVVLLTTTVCCRRDVMDEPNVSTGWVAAGRNEEAWIAPAPAGDPATLSWHRLATIPVARPSGLVGFAGGYAALSDPRTVWYSPDAADWRRIDLPFAAGIDPSDEVLDATVRGIATDGRQLLVVGGYSTQPCREQHRTTVGAGPACFRRPTAWLSTDGSNWRNVSGPQLPDASFDQGGEFAAVWSVPSGGWDASLCYWTGIVCAGRDVMHSADGSTWTALARAPAPQIRDLVLDDRPWVNAGVADRSGRRILWQVWTAWDPASADDSGGYTTSTSLTGLTASADGQSWRAIDGFSAEDAEVRAGVVAETSSPPTWILAGATLSDLAGPAPTVWTSADGSSWTTSLMASPHHVGSVSSLVRTANGYVAVGVSLDPDSVSHETWVSGDGLGWTALPGSTDSAPDSGPALVADGPAGVIGIGSLPNAGGAIEMAVWRLE